MAETKIPARILDALEREHFYLLPAGLYRRSFLRKYADFLGLPGASYADEYARRSVVEQPEALVRDTAETRPHLAPVAAVLTAARVLAVAGLVLWTEIQQFEGQIDAGRDSRWAHMRAEANTTPRRPGHRHPGQQRPRSRTLTERPPRQSSDGSQDRRPPASRGG